MSSYYKRNKYAFVKRKLREPKLYTEHICLNSKIFYPEEEEFFQVGIFDPGTVSCAMRVVRYGLETNTMSIVAFQTINFGESHIELMERMISVFEPLYVYLENCHHIIVEHQLMKNEDIYQGFSIMMYVLANYVCTRKMLPMLIEVDCQLKTVFIGGPKTKKQNTSPEMIEWYVERYKKLPVDSKGKRKDIEIKEWTKMMSRKISEERGDLITYHVLENSIYKGNEDLSDTVCYEYAYVSYILQRVDIFLPFDRKKLS